MRRINDKFCIGWRFYISLFTIRKTRQDQTAAGSPLHRIYRASPHSRGGASYAVTHSRRKYHHTHMQFVARCCAIAALRRWPRSLRPPGVRPPFTGDHPCVPAARLRAYRMYLIALFSCSQALSLLNGKYLLLLLNIPGNCFLLIIRRNFQNFLKGYKKRQLFLNTSHGETYFIDKFRTTCYTKSGTASVNRPALIRFYLFFKKFISICATCPRVAKPWGANCPLP